jgi:transposase-like protein
MTMTKSEELAIRAAAAQAQALSQSLMSMIAREEPKNGAPKCPSCGSADVATGGDTLVCADCNTNFEIESRRP